MRRLASFIVLVAMAAVALSALIAGSAEICPQGCNADIVILIDRSGTMAADFGNGSSKYEVAVGGVIDFLNSTCTDGRFWIGIIEFMYFTENITYSGSPSNGILFNISSESVVQSLISKLEARMVIPPVGLSMMGYAIGNATNMLSTGRDDVDDYIILVSDGLTHQDPWSQVDNARSKGIKIISVFIGDPRVDNDELLADISDIFINISDPSVDVGSVLTGIYNQICPARTPVLVGGLIVPNDNGVEARVAYRLPTLIAIALIFIVSGYIIYRSNS
ncbi:MAG: VWA domain-containing protein [Desulfurococcales archaeon]|nr:VWA domain-containing protein [Desulfurococcales archaeon]